MIRLTCSRRPRLARVLLTAAVLYSVTTSVPAAGSRHEGVATCASTTCHGAARPLSGTPVLQNEYVTWSEFDPHAAAFRTLLGPRSRAMGRRLGLAAPEQAPACLACHAEVVPPGERGPKFQPDDGVGCESCHGAAQGWLATHDDGAAGTHAESLRGGLRALDEPAVLAKLCTGCHVGDGDRRATHAMMAAGHPRLSFELDTFAELWRTSGGREHYRGTAPGGVVKPGASPPMIWLTGLVEASRVSVDQTQAAVGQGALPDFAAFNCYSCHRNMGRGEPDAATPATPAATPRDTPGALRLNDSALRLLTTAAQAREAAAAVALRKGLGDLQQAANQDTSAVMPAADALRRQLAGFSAALDRSPVQPADAQAMLAAVLSASKAGAYPDYATAEQAAMAVVVLMADAGAKPRYEAEIDALFATLDNDTAFDAARFARMLGRLGDAAKVGK